MSNESLGFEKSDDSITWKDASEKIRFLVIVDANFNVTFADDLTFDEAKVLLRRWAIMTTKISAAQAEANRKMEN